MPRAGRILIALLLGMAAGLVARWLGAPGLAFAGALKPLGQLWLNALQMTLVPMVFCLMTGGAAALAEAAGTGRLVGAAVALFVALLFAASIAGAVGAEALMALWPFHVAPFHASAAVAVTAAGAARGSMADQVVALVPVNPVAAAAQAAMAPLIVFAAALGAAASRLPPAQRESLLAPIRAGGAAMLVIVGWVLWAAPVGVFALALGASSSLGLAAAAGLAQYVLLVTGVLAIGLVCALAIGLFSRVGPGRFLRAVAAPAALAASTQSSMACLPALIEAAQTGLGLPARTVAALMPLTVTVFRFGNVFGGVSAGLIGARLYGIEPSLPAIALAVGIGVLSNLGVVGIPGAAVLVAAFGPIYSALGAPLEALTVLIAIYTLPDILDTMTNVTADLAVVSHLVRAEPGKSEPAQPGPPESSSPP